MNRILSAAALVRAELARHVEAAQTHTQRANELQTALTALSGTNGAQVTNLVRISHTEKTTPPDASRTAQASKMRAWHANLSTSRKRAMAAKRRATWAAKRASR